ncbi:hypothetical protein [Henriciella sp.]|uniref:hypothetical protein n=1 Tax=Henriciella sp. TaxID=1968823 RepID=UPI00261E058B|nr:hypothetical protein [Henriciella sp.]
MDRGDPDHHNHDLGASGASGALARTAIAIFYDGSIHRPVRIDQPVFTGSLFLDVSRGGHRSGRFWVKTGTFPLVMVPDYLVEDLSASESMVSNVKQDASKSAP